MKYRKEIDGLRGVAIFPVILFHAGFNAFEGGYVGVDVFFVISGYLITSIILSDLTSDGFSFVRFYERRVRRILPALYFVMLCCLPLAWIWLWPSHYKDFSQSLVAVSLFSSNVLFWRQFGYFETAAELRPLLHTWSLGVEEQFYLLFPILVLALWKFGRRSLFGGLTLLGMASFVLAEWGVRHDPSAAFFLLPMRAWELALGALIACYFRLGPDHERFVTGHRALSEVLGITGLGLICFAVLVFDANTPVPGFPMLIPAAGAALIILFTHQETAAGRILGSRPLAGLGLISFSAYLWHQPLFAFARHRCLTFPGPGLYLVLSLVSILLACLSWRFVEMPFRVQGRFSRKTVFGLAAGGFLFFVAAGFWGHTENGFENRLSKKVTQPIDLARRKSSLREKWVSWKGHEIKASGIYTELNQDLERENTVFLIGDSHAESLAEALRTSLAGSKFSFMVLTSSGCPPVLDVDREDRRESTDCRGYNQEVYTYVEKTDAVKHVIVASRWSLYVDGRRFDNQEGGLEPGSPVMIGSAAWPTRGGDSAAQRSQVLKNAFVTSLDRLLASGKQVFIVYPFPETGWDVGDYLSKYAMFREADLSTLSPDVGSTGYELFKGRNSDAIDILDSLGTRDNLVRIHPERIFCNTYSQGRCAVQNKGDIFYRDDNHLSFTGAGLVAKEILRRLN